MSKRATGKTPPIKPVDDGVMDWDRFDDMTDAEIAAAAACDRDSRQPKSPERLASVRQVSPAKFLRMKLAMSQAQFARAYGIPLAKLAAWERRDLEPTDVELTYLRLIERVPEHARLVPAE